MKPDDLVLAIQHAPDDNKPRLAYAAALGKRKDAASRARGEFIRLHCELSSLLPEGPPWTTVFERAENLPEEAEDFVGSEQAYHANDWGQGRLVHLRRCTAHRLVRWPVSDQRVNTLLQRLDELLAEHAEDWLLEASPFVLAGTFRRGMLERVSLGATAFLEHGEELLQHECIRHVTLFNAETEQAEAVAELPLLQRLTGLGFRGNFIRSRGAVALADSPHVVNLKLLDLHGQDIEERGAAALAESDYLCKLRVLDLHYGGICTDGLMALAKSKTLGNLEVLDLDDCGGFSSKAMRALAKSTTLTKLTALNLNRNEIGSSTALLRDAPVLANLTELDLGWNEIGTQTAKALAGSKHLKRLTALGLASGEIGDAGLEALAKSPNLAGIRFLNLMNCSITDRGARAIAQSPHFKKLEELAIHHNQVGPEGLRELATSPSLPALNTIRLGGNNLERFKDAEPANGPARLRALELWADSDHHGHILDAEGIRRLAALPYLSGLTSLNLGGNQLGPGVATALAESPHLGNLVHLNLDGNEIGPDGAATLAGSKNLANLATLVLARNKLGDRGVAVLAGSKHLKRLEVVSLQENEIGADGAKALTAAQWAGLVRLDLSANDIGTAGAKALAGAKHLKRLEYLDLSSSKIGPAGAKALAGSIVLAKVRSLDLAACYPGDDGVVALCRSRSLTRLTHLDLQNNELGDRSALALAGWPSLARLVRLSLRYNRIDREGAETLRSSPHRSRMLDGDIGATLDLECNSLSTSGDLPGVIERVLRRQPPLEGETPPPDYIRQDTYAIWFSHFVPLIVFARQGQVAASVSQAGPIVIWDTAGGAVLRTLPTPPFHAAVALAADATLLVGADAAEVQVWNVVEARCVERFPAGQVLVYGVAIAPDGKRIATAGHDRTVVVREMPGGKVIRRLTGPEDRVVSVAFSPDGQRIAAGSADGTLRVWNVADGLETLQIGTGDSICSGAVCSIAFSHDGGRLVSIANENAVTWHAVTGESLARLHHQHSATFSADGQALIASSMWDQGASVWDMGEESQVNQTANLPLRLLRGPAPISDAPGDLGALQSPPPRSRAADPPLPPMGPVSVPDEFMFVQGGAVHGLAFSPNGKYVATGGQDCSFRLWDAAGRLLRAWATGYRAEVLAFSADGETLAVATDWGEVYLLDCTTGRRRAAFKHDNDTAQAIALSPDGSVILVGYESGLAAYHVADGRHESPIQLDAQALHWAICPRGNRGAVAGNKNDVAIFDLATGQRLHRLEAHTNEVLGLAISDDGSRLASCSKDGTVGVWDVASGQEVLTLSTRDTCCALTPDGRVLATGEGRGGIQLWEMQGGRELLQLGNEPGILRLSFSPDGKRLAAATSSGTVRVHLVAPQIEKRLKALGKPTAAPPKRQRLDFVKPVRVLQHENYVLSAFMPDGGVATACYDKVVRVWSATGEVVRQWETASHANGVAVDRKGTVYAVDWSGTVYAWDSRTGKQRYRVKVARCDVNGFALSPDQKVLAVGDREGIVSFWDAATGKKLHTGNVTHGGEVFRVAFSPDGKLLASSGGDWLVRLWDVSSGKEVYLLGDSEHRNVRGVAFTPDGKRLAAGHENFLLLWDIATGKVVQQLSDSGVLSLCFTPDGGTLFTAQRQGVQVWDVESGKELHLLQGNDGPEILTLAFDPVSKRLLSGSQDKTARIWDLAGFFEQRGEGKVPRAPPVTVAPYNGAAHIVKHDWDVYCVAFTPDSQFIVSGGYRKEVLLWDAGSGKVRQRMQGPGEMRSLMVTPDGQRVIGGTLKGDLLAWKIKGVRPSARDRVKQDYVRSLALSPDGSLLAIGADGGYVGLADAVTLKLVRALPRMKDDVWKVAFSSDGKLLLAMSPKTIRLFDVAGGKVFREFPAGMVAFRGAALSPDGSRLAITTEVDDEGFLCLWNADTGKQVWKQPAPHAQDVAYSPDGRTIATAMHWGEIRLWDASMGQFVRGLRGLKSVSEIVFSPDGQRLASGGDDYTARVWNLGEGTS